MPEDVLIDMRTIAIFIVLVVATATLALACSRESPPSAAQPVRHSAPLAESPKQVGQQTTPPSDSQTNRENSAEIVAAQTTSSHQAGSPPARANMIIRLEAELSVYPWTGDYWRPVGTFGPRTLLLVDGWTVTGDGVIWLHLDLNGPLEGWARRDASPVTLEEAHSLPQLPSPELPLAQLPGPEGRQVTVSVLGQSADTARVAVRPAQADLVLWVDRSEFEDGRQLDGLPVYTGPDAGHWQLWRAAEGTRLEVEVSSWSSAFAAWPDGPRVSWGLRSGKYPLLGRSLDSEWLALRVDALEPPVVWVRVGLLDEDIDLDSLPIFLSTGAEVMTLDRDGRAVSSRFAPDPMNNREWRNEHEILLRGGGDGTWLWDIEIGTLRQVTELTVANVSPDGRFAVARMRAEPNAESDWRDPLDVALVSLVDGGIATFSGVFSPWPTDVPGFQQFWSADSRWLLSTLYRYADEDRTRQFALSVDGALVEIIPPEGRWVTNWSALRDLEQAGGEVVYLNAEGQEIARPWSDEVFEPDESTLAPYPPLPDGWWPEAWSPDARMLLAGRVRWTEPVDEQGLAALPAQGKRWHIYEIGIFDREGRLVQLFRGYGGECGLQWSEASWSPDGRRILFEPRWTSCA